MLFHYLNDVTERIKKVLHRGYLASKGVKRVTKLVREGSFDNRQEGLLCFCFIVKNFVRHVYNLDKDLGLIIRCNGKLLSNLVHLENHKFEVSFYSILIDNQVGVCQFENLILQE